MSLLSVKLNRRSDCNWMYSYTLCSCIRLHKAQQSVDVSIKHIKATKICCYGRRTRLILKHQNILRTEVGSEISKNTELITFLISLFPEKSLIHSSLASCSKSGDFFLFYPTFPNFLIVWNWIHNWMQIEYQKGLNFIITRSRTMRSPCADFNRRPY